MKQIKNIVFDQGKVLLDFTVQKVLSPYFPAPDDFALAKAAVFDSGDWDKIDLGLLKEIDALDRWLEKLPQRLHAATVEFFEHWHEHMTPVEGMLALVQTLKKNGYRCYLLSNTSPRYYTFYRTVEVMRLLDGYIVSAVHRLFKPDTAIYQRLFDTYGLDPEECFFVDDVAENIDAGKRLGMRGFQFVDFDVSGLKKALLTEGVRL